MPANLPPQYFEAEKEYRDARTVEEKIHALKKMLAIMPKHKGTDKLQAEIRAKISKLQEELEHLRKGKKGSPHWYVKREGAGQVAIVGLTNSGKTTLLNSLCGTNFETAEYPFTTRVPNLGMMDFEDIKFQIVDNPPLKHDVDYKLLEILRNADLLVIALDLTSDPLKDFQEIENILSSKNIYLIGIGEREYELFGPANKRALMVLNKLDLTDNLEKLKGVESFFGSERKFPCISVSAIYGNGTEELKNKIFQELEIIRVYTKEPGKPPVLKDPLILKRGGTVLDAARQIHKDFEKNLKYAKVWGSTKFEGQRVERNYQLKDKDIVEFHI